MSRLESKISIDPIDKHINNVYGYIDIGFSIATTDLQYALDEFNSINLKEVADSFRPYFPIGNLYCVGNSIIYSPGGISTKGGLLPAHLNNFLEIMCDGSAKMRLLLQNNQANDSSVNMFLPFYMLDSYRVLYSHIMGNLFPQKFVYAKKYESLTVLKQFQPSFIYSHTVVGEHPELSKQNMTLASRMQADRSALGITSIITNDRIPKTGLYTIDKQAMEKWGITDYTADSIIEELFNSRFVRIGFPQLTDNT